MCRLQTPRISAGDRLEIPGHLLELLGGDADGAVHWNAGTSQERGEQVALIAFGIGQESARVDGAAALACDDEGKVFAGVLVSVFQAGAPHHDAVFEKRAVAFAEAGRGEICEEVSEGRATFR